VAVRVSKASAILVQRVPSSGAAWFLDWQQGLNAAAEGFAGYPGADVYPPADERREEWVVMIHFDHEQNLRDWLSSPVRAEWVAKLRAQFGDCDLQTLPGGFGSWFTDLARPAAPPPPWKMVLTVLCGLYPTVMLLTIFVSPYLAPLGLALTILLSNALCCCILQWVVMPLVTAGLDPWLKANGRQQRLASLGGVGLLLLLLAGLALVFRKVTD